LSLVDAQIHVDFTDDDIPDAKFDYLSDRYCDELEVVLDAELDALRERVLSRFPKGMFTIRTEV